MAYCWCGRVVKDFNTIGGTVLYCPIHQHQWMVTPDKRDKIGKYSGPSKRFKGGYEKDWD